MREPRKISGSARTYMSLSSKLRLSPVQNSASLCYMDSVHASLLERVKVYDPKLSIETNSGTIMSS